MKPTVEQVARVIDPVAYDEVGGVPEWARGYALRNRERAQHLAEGTARAVLALFDDEPPTGVCPMHGEAKEYRWDYSSVEPGCVCPARRSTGDAEAEASDARWMDLWWHEAGDDWPVPEHLPGKFARAVLREQHPARETDTHYCDNCLGIDPASCATRED